MRNKQLSVVSRQGDRQKRARGAEMSPEELAAGVVCTRNFGAAVSPSERVKSVSSATLRPFGPIGAARHDEDKKHVPRKYKTACAVQNELLLTALRASRLSHPAVLDLGCGTATDGLHILSNVPRAIYIGVDYAPDMLARANHKLISSGFAKRSDLLQNDFRRLSARNVYSATVAIEEKLEFECVLSALALHHYALVEKRPVYELAHAVLAPGGLLIMTDLYRNSCLFCDGYAEARELADISRAEKRITQNNAQTVSYSTITKRHYAEDNRPEELKKEADLLRQIGFREVDTVYRDGQLAVLVAER